MTSRTSRRDLLTKALLGGAGALFLGSRPTWAAAGQMVGTVEFDTEWPAAFDEPFGTGLNGRLVHKLATLTDETLVTPTERFFIRTRKPALLDTTAPWRIAVGGHVDRPEPIELEPLMASVEPQGVHVLECSGNPRRRSFGLMSAAAWSGIPIETVLDRTRPSRRATRVLISGFDEHAGTGGGTPGASWIFDPADLAAAGAFFATHMNGERLNDDHGFPVRLYVPGWYGCACAKWVDRIEWVDDDAPATSQMREYASRTHNDGTPELAKDYRPGEMDLAAMPVRVEKWTSAEGTRYRIVGIAWGGKRKVDGLEIRIGEAAAWVAVDDFVHRDVATWNLWSHTWTPGAPGSYAIRLRVPDASVPTRRIDAGYYDRTVTLEAL